MWCCTSATSGFWHLGVRKLENRWFSRVETWRWSSKDYEASQAFWNLRPLPYLLWHIWASHSQTSHVKQWMTPRPRSKESSMRCRSACQACHPWSHCWRCLEKSSELQRLLWSSCHMMFGSDPPPSLPERCATRRWRTRFSCWRTSLQSPRRQASDETFKGPPAKGRGRSPWKHRSQFPGCRGRLERAGLPECLLTFCQKVWFKTRWHKAASRLP
mmetsp:Transcript_16280/g.38473  ORF Transcript_16280/g.38473 Transcript_16280/m.38473 type:complete len:215 (-) Transcript_16280:1338-1982(-)